MRASRTIRDYPGDISRAYQDNSLLSLPGISEEVYGYIQEFLRPVP
ncbi:MAG: hypothetical protein U5N58_08210 [Actinomycetota bacterium]|nr:hypothetical protein [Actinomycetota bacterium]